MPKLLVDPDYQRHLEAAGLTSVNDFLDLNGVIYSGHLDRNVSRVVLDLGQQRTSSFLKREHRTKWKDQLENWANGFGWVSKSLREFQTLQTLRKEHICKVPIPLAAGENDKRQAFLLLADIPGVVDLREWLGTHNDPTVRSDTLTTLAETIAHVHASVWVHKDLYSKHILLASSDDITLLDWQRAIRSRSWDNRFRDLATLHATIAPHLAPDEEQLAFLRSYLDHMSTRERSVPTFSDALSQIQKHRSRLWEKRRFREMRQPPLRAGTQNLIWLDGEKFCVSREFADIASDEVLEELKELIVGQVCNLPKRKLDKLQTCPTKNKLAQLVIEHQSHSTSDFWNWFRKRQPVGHQFEVAKTIFQLERFGVLVPKVLAVGHQVVSSGVLRSFLLTECPQDVIPLKEWLSVTSITYTDLRQDVLRKVAQVWHTLHELGYLFGNLDVLGVTVSGSQATVMIVDPQQLKQHQRKRSSSDLTREWFLASFRSPSGVPSASVVRDTSEDTHFEEVGTS